MSDLFEVAALRNENTQLKIKFINLARRLASMQEENKSLQEDKADLLADNAFLQERILDLEACR